MSTCFISRIDGEVRMETAIRLQEEIKHHIRSGAKNIVLRINSPGGEVEAGLLIHEVVKNCPVPVTGVAEGECGSIAFTILQACNSRGAYPDTSFRVHFLNFNTSAIVFYNEKMRLIVRAKHMGLQEEIIRVHLERSKVSREALLEMMLQDRHISSQRAMDLGMIDAVVIDGR